MGDESQDQEQVYADRQELNQKNKLLFSAMKTLNPREQYIIQKRRLSENAATLEELGSEFGISRERVRQVEVKAFEKLQKTSRPSSWDQTNKQVLVETTELIEPSQHL